nr:hypothetical protein [Tanacetum cinerariifolium]
MTSEQFGLGPAPQFLTPGYISLGLVQNLVSSKLYVPPSKKDYDILCQPLFEEYFQPPSRVVSHMLSAAAQLFDDTTGTPSPTIIVQDVPSVSTSPTTQEIQSLVVHQGVEEKIQGFQNAQFVNEPILHNLTPNPSFKESSSQGVIPSSLHQLSQSFDNLSKWSKDHPLENVIGNPSRPVLTRSQLQTHAVWCYFDAYRHHHSAKNGLVELVSLKGRIMMVIVHVSYANN